MGRELLDDGLLWAAWMDANAKLRRHIPPWAQGPAPGEPGSLENPVVLNGHDFSTDDYLRTGAPLPTARPAQLDRIEALLQELVDRARREDLYRELDRLTRDWRP